MFPHSRKFPRFTISFPVRLQPREPGASAVHGLASSTDLSVQGAGVTLSDPFELKSDVSVGVTLAVEEGQDLLLQIQFEAKVAWIQGPRCGLEITNLSGEDFALYENLLVALGRAP